jgi:hypothetical protein
MRTVLLLTVLLSIPAAAVAQDTDQLYQRACDGGDFSACTVFAEMLETGQGVPQDIGRAVRLHTVACDGGQLESCANLGRMYENGVGVPQDLARARSRYRVACQGGDSRGCDLLATLAVTHPELEDSLFSKVVTVTDAETSQTLAETLVELPALGIRETTDADGRLSLDDLPEGRFQLRAERLGYQAVQGTLSVPGSQEVLVQLDPLEMADAGAPGRIRGQVLGEQDEPLALVQVTLVGPDGEDLLQALTDDEGRFVLENVPPGMVGVRFARLGYAPRMATLVMQPDATAEIAAAMANEIIELDPIEVTANARSIELEQSAYLQRNGFYDRATRGFGGQFSRQMIEERNPQLVSDLAVKAPSVRLRYSLDPHVVVAENPRAVGRRSCPLDVYIDGVRTDNPNLNQIDPDRLEGFELYAGNDTPVRYRRAGGCGAVLLWTRR